MNRADYRLHIEEDARLVILRELAVQPDGRLNETILRAVLDASAHSRSREWVRTQLNKLAELGAVTLQEFGTVYVAAITRAGADHVERRAFIAGVKRPSLGE